MFALCLSPVYDTREWYGGGTGDSPRRETVAAKLRHHQIAMREQAYQFQPL